MCAVAARASAELPALSWRVEPLRAAQPRPAPRGRVRRLRCAATGALFRAARRFARHTAEVCSAARSGTTPAALSPLTPRPPPPPPPPGSASTRLQRWTAAQPGAPPRAPAPAPAAPHFWVGSWDRSARSRSTRALGRAAHAAADPAPGLAGHRRRARQAKSQQKASLSGQRQRQPKKKKDKSLII